MATLGDIVKQLQSADSEKAALFERWLTIMNGGSMIGLEKMTDGMMGMPISKFGSGRYARSSANKMIAFESQRATLTVDWPRPY